MFKNAIRKKYTNQPHNFSALIMLDTQKKWYEPEPSNAGWHVGCMSFIPLFHHDIWIFELLLIFQSGTLWVQSGLPYAGRWVTLRQTAKRCIKANYLPFGVGGRS